MQSTTNRRLRSSTNDSALDPTIFETCGVKIELSGSSQPDNIVINHSFSDEYRHFGLFRRDKEQCDVTAIVGKEKISGLSGREQQALLCARIPFIRALFKWNMNEGSSGVINLSSSVYDPTTVHSLLNFAYNGSLCISETNFQDVTMGAEMETVMKECVRFIERRLSIDNALPLLSFCKTISDKKLDRFIRRFIDANVVPISFTTDFLSLPMNDLIDILDRDSLNIDNERQAYKRNYEKGNELVSFKTAERVCYDAHRLLFSITMKDMEVYSMDTPSTIDLYDPLTHSWHRSESSSSPDDFRSIVAIRRKMIFVGFDHEERLHPGFEVYDTQKCEWNQVVLQTAQPEHIGAIGVIDGIIYVAGGACNDGVAYKTMQTLDPFAANPDWSLRTSMSKKRVLPASCVMDGKLYVIGDCYRQRVWNDGEYYDTQKDTWNMIASMKKGMIYLVGGCERSSDPFTKHSLDDVERYDPSTDSWSTLSSMINKRRYCYLTVSCGKLIVFGGFNDNDDDCFVGTVEMYDLESDRWKILTTMLERSAEAFLCALSVPATFPTQIAFLDNVSMTSSGFQNLQLKSDLLRAIIDLRFDYPSKVQEECFPQLILGKNMICQSESGSGKTSLYVMATLNQLEGDGGQVIVLSSSREIARRIEKEYDGFSKYLEINSGVCDDSLINLKGSSLKSVSRQIIIGTPGRILNLIQSGIINSGNINQLIVDEFDFNIHKDVEKIIELTTEKKQIMIFSSNLHEKFHKVCKDLIPDRHQIHFHSINRWPPSHKRLTD